MTDLLYEVAGKNMLNTFDLKRGKRTGHFSQHRWVSHHAWNPEIRFVRTVAGHCLLVRKMGKVMSCQIREGLYRPSRSTLDKLALVHLVYTFIKKR